MSPDPPPGHPRLTLAQLWVSGAAVLLGLAYLWGIVIPEELSRIPEGFGPMRHWDLETYFLPKFAFGSSEMLRGDLPVWNRFEFGGVPFLAAAQPAAVYIPKILLFGLWDPGTALRLFMIGHFVLLAALFLIFARDQGMGRVGALAGVAFCTFNIPFLTATGHPMEIANLAWVPLLFLISERIGRSPSIVAVAGLAAAVAVQITAGYPQFTMDCGVLLAVHAVVRFVTGAWPHPPWKTIPLLLAGFLMGAMVAGIQVLPLADLVLFTGRLDMAEEMASRTEAFSSAVYLRLLLAFPALLGFAGAGIDRRGVAPLVGALTCVFILVGGWRLLRLLPGFSAVRLAGTWPLLLQFFLAWLVAHGASRFATSDPAERAGPIARVLVGGVGLSWAIVCLVAGLLPEWIASSPLARFLGLSAEGRPFLVSGLGLAGGLLLAAFAFGTGRLRDSRVLATGGVGLVLAGQLSAFPFGRALGHLAPPEVAYRSTKLIPKERLGSSRVLSLFDARGGFHLLDRVENPFGREGSLPPPRLTKVEKHLGVVVQMMRISWEELARSRGFLDTFDVRFLVAPRTLAGPFARLGFRDTGLGDRMVAVLEAEDPLGRAWGVYGVTLAGSPEAAFDRLLSPDFDPRRQVILDTSPRGEYPRLASGPPTPARVRHLAPTLTEVEVEMRSPGVLVLADSCFPGWRVSVDGHPTTLLCANYLVRGVELEQGHHLVRFEYRPASVRWGLGLSALALPAVAGVLLRAAWRRRTRRARALKGAA